MNDIKLNYPIKLYMKKSFLLFAVIFCIFMTWVSYYGYAIAIKDDSLLILAMCVLSMLMFAPFTLVFIAIWILNQPTITINLSSIEFFNLFKKNKKIFWSQIETMELYFYMHKSVKHWRLIILPKQEYGEEIIYPLRTMDYQDVELNEKEIFTIIEQSFQGKRPTYKNVKMGLESRVAFNKYFGGFMFAIAILIFIFVFGGFK